VTGVGGCVTQKSNATTAIAWSDYGAVEVLIKEAVQIGLARDMGTDYFADPRGRLLGIKDKNGQISTGWPSMDRRLFGGMNRGELNIFAGGSGAGKSLFLANLGVKWALQGLNVVYLTLELSEALVSMRIDSMVTGVSTREIFKNLDDIEMKVKMIGKKSGMLQVKYMPSGKTVNDIRAYLKEVQMLKIVKKIAHNRWWESLVLYQTISLIILFLTIYYIGMK
jgi:archaellum biogenesis ATPase FlaH